MGTLEDNPHQAYIYTNEFGEYEVAVGELIRGAFMPDFALDLDDTSLMLVVEALASHGKEYGELCKIETYLAKKFNNDILVSKTPYMVIEKQDDDRGKYVFVELSSGTISKYDGFAYREDGEFAKTIFGIVAEILFPGAYAIDTRHGFYYVDSENLDWEYIKTLSTKERSKYFQENAEVYLIQKE